MMNLETGEQSVMKAKTGFKILLMDMIDTNIVYGLVKNEDIVILVDGKVLAPLSIVEIATVDQKVLKSYSKEGYYVSDLEVNGNVIELKRVQKSTNQGHLNYVAAEEDFIMNQVIEENSIIKINSRVTEQALTEYYFKLPSGLDIKELPSTETTKTTVISKDPTVRLDVSASHQETYYPYIRGNIKGSYKNAAEAIQIADDEIGVVVNHNGQVIWERSVRVTKAVQSEFENMTWSGSGHSTMEHCLALIAAYEGKRVNEVELSADTSAYEWLTVYAEVNPIRLTGATLDEIFYYISIGKPVIAMTSEQDAVLIYGYDAYNIMVIDPKKQKPIKMGLQDSKKLFDEAGNIYISYIQ